MVSLKGDEINQVTTDSVNDMLIGEVAGVRCRRHRDNQVEASDIRIRGVGSVFSQKPLGVVMEIIGDPIIPMTLPAFQC